MARAIKSDATTMVGATAAAAGTGGSVPAPAIERQDLVLHGDGLWRQAVPNWTAATEFSVGAVVHQGASIWRKLAPAEVAGLTFDAAEQAKWELVSTVGAVERFHLTETAVAPAVAGQPTTAELQAAVAAAGLRNQLAYYTATDTPADTPVSWWDADSAGFALPLATTTATADPPFTATFTTADWVLNAGNRTITYLAAVHGQGSLPFVSVSETAGPDYDDVGVWATTNQSGDVTVTVPDGNEFDGRIKISAGLGGARNNHDAAFVAGDWTPSGGDVVLTIPSATHGVDPNPRTQTFETAGGGHRQVGIQTDVAANGDVTFTAAAAFDGRYTIF